MDAIIIGLGGMGRETVAILRRLIQDERAPLNVRFVGIDVDPTPPQAAPLDYNIEIYLRDVKESIEEFKKRDRGFREWWIENYYPNPPQNKIEGNTAANQVRIHGRLAFYNRYEKIREELKSVINTYSNTANLYVFIISSLGGGTGSGVFLDTAALIRFLRPNVSIYGFFIDGTVTYRLVDRDTGGYNTLMNSYACIAELMHWMKHPETYNMGEIKKIDNLFDICFIFQDRNKNDLTFVQNEISILKKNYFNLIANTLYPILGIKEFTQSTIGNDWTRYFGNLRGESKEIAFSGAAVGKITFSKEKIADYILTYVIEEVLKDSGSEIEKKFTDIEKDKGIKERENSTLTEYLKRNSDQWGFLNELMRTIERKMKDNASNDRALRSLQQNYALITRTDILPETLRSSFDGYKDEVRRLLSNKFEEVKKEIENIINEGLEQRSIESLIKWLLEAKGAIEKNIEHIDKAKGKYNPQEKLTELKKGWEEIFKVKGKKLLGGVNPRRMSRINNYVSAYENYIRSYVFKEVEYPLLLEFYKELKNLIENWLITFNILKGKVKDVLDDFRTLRGKITYRDIPLDKQRLINREYPLEVKVDLNFDIIDRDIRDAIMVQLRKDKEIESFVSKIWKGDYVENKFLPGLKDFVSSIFEKVKEGKDAEARADDFINKNISEMANKIFKENIKNRLQDFSIQDILRWWLGEMLFPKVKKLVDNRRIEDLGKLAIEWSVIFGQESSQLTNIENAVWRESEEKVKKKWVDEALIAYIKKLDEYVKPFINYYDAKNVNRIKDLLPTEGQLSTTPTAKTVFYPQGFDDEILNRLGWKPTKVELPSSSIFIYSQDLRISPHSLEDYEYFEGFEIRKSYLDHVEYVNQMINSNQPLSVSPYHIDTRFYTQWKSLIGEIKPEEYIYWLVIVALGLGVLRRDKYKGSKKKVFIYGSKKVADTLPKTVKVFNLNSELKESLKKSCGEEIEKLYITHGRKFDVIEERVFKKAFGILKGLRGGEHPVWEAMYKMVEYDPAGRRASENKVPKSWEEFRTVWERI